MVQALVTAEVLRWARERAGASLDAVADKLKVQRQIVEGWESGESLPSFAKARDLAKYLCVPFGYFFLDVPPKETITVPDLRRIGGDPIETLGPDFLEIYRDACAKQDWYREYLLSQGAQQLAFVGRYTTDADISTVASDMRRVLDITADWRSATTNWEDMFRALVNKTELAGVLVLRNSVVGNNTSRPLSVQEFRGFALSDPIAPLVFINSGDAPPAQIFSLAHELCHIWLNISAISNFSLQAQAKGHDPIEVFCNAAAAEFLVPRLEFLAHWNDNLNLEQNVNALTREFRVSGLVIVRRALDLECITRADFLRFYDRAATERQEAPKKKGGGPDFYTLSRMRNSPTFARAVLNEAFEGRMLLRDAGLLLSVTPDKLKQLARKLEA